MKRAPSIVVIVLSIFTVFVVACGTTPQPQSQTQTNKPDETTLKVGVVIDAGSEDDRSYGEYTLKGAREAAEANGLELIVLPTEASVDYDKNIEKLITQGAKLVITIGFQMGPPTAKVAQSYPNTHFAIVDNAYFPGAGCAETVEDCYSKEGGLTNVTSLMFAEDEVGYLAGVLAACMSESETIATVAGREIPPVVRYVTGFQQGAKSLKPDITLLNQYIPDFTDPASGKTVAQDFILQGADVIFAVAGKTGNGALLAAHEANKMAIGVDVDQYYTYMEVRESLLSSAMKNVDVAAASAVTDFVNGTLQSGIRIATLEENGVGLAPYHDWEDTIPDICKDAIHEAKQAIVDNPDITVAK